MIILVFFFCSLEIFNYEYSLLQEDNFNNNDFPVYNKIKIEEKYFDLKFIVETIVNFSDYLNYLININILIYCLI